MAPASFIIRQNLGRGPDSFFAWTPEILRAAANIQCDAIRRLIRDRLEFNQGLLVRYTAPGFEKTYGQLTLWAEFVRRSPVITSYGQITSADLPSILSAIAILEPIVAAIRGERVEQREVA